MKKKKKRSPVLIGILLIIIVITVTGILFFRPYVRFTEGKKVLEKGETYEAMDFILKSNGEVTPEAKTLDTEETGKHYFHYKVKKGVFEKDAILLYEVTDTTPPVIEIKNDPVYKDPLESYSEKEMADNIVINEGTLSFESDYNNETTGTYTVKVKATDECGNESVAEYEVVVRDIEAPFVFRTGNGAKVQKGSDFDLAALLSYGDNADPKPVLTYEGTVNTFVNGYYPLHACLTDASGNSTHWDLTVEVVSRMPETEPDEYFYPFEDFLTDYQGENRRFGIDVSAWQGDIDFEAVKQAGCEFAIIRIGYSYLGELHLDKKYEQNIKGAKEAGLPVGIYLFCYDNNEADLLKSLEQVFKELNGIELELPVVFDWENFDNYHEYEINFEELNRLYDVFTKEVEKQGYESMLYGSKFYLQNVWSHTDTRNVWLAHYVLSSPYEDPYTIWQVSDSGRLAGIEGPVDLDVQFVAP